MICITVPNRTGWNRALALSLVASALALPAVAYCAVEGLNLPILSPAWASEPTAEAVRAARPSMLGPQAAGYAILSCRVGQDRGLADCQALREWPAQFGVASAALSLADQYRSDKPTGSRLQFPIVFNPERARLDRSATGDAGLVERLQLAMTRPVRETPSLTLLRCQVEDGGAVRGCQTEYETEIDPGLAAYQIALARTEVYQPAAKRSDFGYVTVFRVMTENTDRPVPERVNAPVADSFYPEAAQGSVGRVSLSCTVAVTGLAKDCRVLSETPSDQGFGAAALEYAGRSTYLPRRIDGIALPAQIDLDIRLSPSQEDVPDAGADGPALPAKADP